jgi:hypothetical protein
LVLVVATPSFGSPWNVVDDHHLAAASPELSPKP